MSDLGEGDWLHEISIGGGEERNVCMISCSLYITHAEIAHVWMGRPLGPNLILLVNHVSEFCELLAVRTRHWLDEPEPLELGRTSLAVRSGCAPLKFGMSHGKCV